MTTDRIRLTLHIQVEILDAATEIAAEQSTATRRVTQADVLREFLAAGHKAITHPPQASPQS
jgi:hypothetical protein